MSLTALPGPSSKQLTVARSCRFDLKPGLNQDPAVIPFKFYAKAYSDAAHAYKSEAGEAIR
jgi:hypothetical protein